MNDLYNFHVKLVIRTLKSRKMKKILITVLAFFTFQAIIFAQGGGFQRQTVEERVTVLLHKLDSAFKLHSSKLAKLDTAFTVLYKAQDAKMKEMMEGGTMPEREVMMAERKKYSDARDEMIKVMITEEEFLIWKEKVEPTMRPQRPAGGMNRQ